MESGKNPNFLTTRMINSQAVSIAFAGSDNADVTLPDIIYYLLKNPRCYKHLMAELDDAAATAECHLTPARFSPGNNLEILMYFNAVVKEFQRIYLSVGGVLERVPPLQGSEIMGKWYPGITLVGYNAWMIHQRPAIFGKYCGEFLLKR